MSEQDLGKLFEAEESVRRWTAEWENASARMELAKQHRNIRTLLSRGDPFMKHHIDRGQMRAIFGFIVHGDLSRLERDLDKIAGVPIFPVGSMVCWKDPAPWEEGITGTVTGVNEKGGLTVRWSEGLSQDFANADRLVRFK